MTDLDDEILFELDGQLEPAIPDQDELDRRAVEAEEAQEDDSDEVEQEIGKRRRERLAPLRQRILDHLRNVSDQWQSWPDVVQSVDISGRRLAEISPINGRMRQAALALSHDGLVEIRLGDTTVYDAIRLLPAGYTNDSKD